MATYYKVTNLRIRRIANEDRKILLEWKFDEGSSTSGYDVLLQYLSYVTSTSTNGKIAREEKYVSNGTSSAPAQPNTGKNDYKQFIIDVPENTTKIRVSMKPNPSNDSWKAAYCDWVYWTDFGDSFTPEVPSAPTIESKQTANSPSTEFKATVDGLGWSTDGSGSNVMADKVVFRLITKNTDGTATYKTYNGNDAVQVRQSSASKTFSGTYGYSYRVQAKTINNVTRTDSNGKSVTNAYESDWSEFSDWIKLAPSKPDSSTVTVTPLSDSSVRLSWTKVDGAHHYRFEYATNETDLTDQSGTYATAETEFDIGSTTITGLEPGSRYLFIMRAVNDQGLMSENAFDPYLEIVLGAKPSAPTTWSSSTTANIGDIVNLYWIHNTEDGSAERESKVTLKVGGVEYIQTVSNTNKNDYGELIDKTRVVSLVYDSETNCYIFNELQVPISDGDRVEWFVQTKGVKDTFSDPSITRVISFYEKPTISVLIEGVSLSDYEGNVFDQFPLDVSIVVGDDIRQKPIGVSASIISTETYTTHADDGDERVILEGTEVYGSYHHCDSNDIQLSLGAGDVDLENGVRYIVKATVSFDSGLTADEENDFIVAWAESDFVVDAYISYDPETMSTQITPVCTYMEEIFLAYLVDADGSYFCDNSLNILYDDMQTSVPENDDTSYIASTPVEGVTLSVYRQNSNGDFIEIESDIVNSGGHVCHDPHPTLDYARYRVVARSEETGSMEYYDVPPFEIQDKRIIMQWDEEWISNYEDGDSPDSVISWSGSMLKLAYNIDISESNTVDSSLVEYLGRSRPVSYYGTQLGESSTWKCEIPKYDKETLYLLRRLAAWPGDVYVREPSGLGYWANVEVSFDLKHAELTVPISFKIQPVEGGV